MKGCLLILTHCLQTPISPESTGQALQTMQTNFSKGTTVNLHQSSNPMFPQVAGGYLVSQACFPVSPTGPGDIPYLFDPIGTRGNLLFNHLLWVQAMSVAFLGV